MLKPFRVSYFEEPGDKTKLFFYSLSPRRNTAAFRRQSALALVDVRREYLLAK